MPNYSRMPFQRSVFRTLLLFLIGSSISPRLGLEAAEPVSSKPVVIAVRPALWRDSLEDWKRYRSERYQVVEIDSEPSPLALRNRIVSEVNHHEKVGNKVVAVMLCGAVITKSPALTTDSEESFAHTTITPTFIAPTTIRFNELHTETLSTDSPFADIDNDGCPDLAIGRIPAQSANDLRRMLHRSIAYETTDDIGDWRDTVHVTAGVGGFGALADGAIEAVARRYLADGLPDRFRLQMTYASTHSPYCPDPRRIKETFLGKLNQGGLFWIYIGHGWIDSLDKFRYGDREEWLCRPEDTALFDTPVGPPIAVLLACFTGAIDAKVDCFAERLLTQPRGPVAVIAGSRVTMPYGMSEFASEMIHSCFERGTTTLGGIVLEAKRSMWRPEGTVGEGETRALNSSAPTSATLLGQSKLPVAESQTERSPAHSPPQDEESAGATEVSPEHASNRTASNFRSAVMAMAKLLSPEQHDLEEEKREHTRLMNLLGDPVLEIRSPRTIRLDAPETLEAGEQIIVAGTTELDGPVALELWHHRDRSPKGLDPLHQALSLDQRYQTMDLNYAKANDLKVSEQVASSQNGQFKVMLSTSPTQRGKYVIRARMQTDKDWAIGTKRITLQRPKKVSPDAVDSNR